VLCLPGYLAAAYNKATEAAITKQLFALSGQALARRTFVAAVAFGSACMLFLACIGTEATPSHGLTPQQILQQAMEVGRDLRSLRSLEISDDGTTVERLFQAPDTVYMKVTPATGPSGFQHEVLFVGSEAFLRRSDGEWEPAQGERQFVTGDIADGDWAPLAYGIDFRRLLSDATLAADEVINGRLTYHIVASFRYELPYPEPDLPGYPDLSPRPAPVLPTPAADYVSGSFDLWIGQGDFYVYRMDIAGSTYGDETPRESFHRSTRFSNFNEPLDIPSPGQN